MLILLVSLLLSAFFTGMEIAFLSANKLRFEIDKKTKNISTLFLSVIFKQAQQFIAALTVGNIISLVIFGLQISQTLQYPLQNIWNNGLFVLLSQIIIATIIVLLIGELLPKSIFKINANLWLSIFAFPLWLIYIFFYPISKITDLLSLLILRIFGLKISQDRKEQSLTRSSLDFWVQENIENIGENEELEHEVKIFQNALDFSRVKLKDCMVPRTEIVALEESVDLNTLKSKFTETGFSKIVIYKNDIDHILGYIHSAEMFTNAAEWGKNLKSMPIVPETMPANKLLSQLMQEKKSLALVVDEFGGSSGIISLEDIMEEIFGEIEDEHDRDKRIARKINEHEYIFSARLEIDYLNQEYDLRIPESEEYVSLAGYILFAYQNFPKLNEVLQIDNYEIKILRLTNSKIELVNLKLLSTKAGEMN